MNSDQEQRIVEALERAANAFQESLCGSISGPGSMEGIAMAMGGNGLEDSVSAAIRDAGSSIGCSISDAMDGFSVELRRGLRDAAQILKERND